MTLDAIAITDQERTDLLAALARDCTCKERDDGTRYITCEPHTLLLNTDVLKHLIFSRRRVASMAKGEWNA